jgi:multidrug efflux pump subunit AcrA (membrane-fusion protein)
MEAQARAGNAPPQKTVPELEEAFAKAQAELEAARGRLEAAQLQALGPAYELANAQLENARAALQNAEAFRAQLAAGPTAEQRASAESVVNSTRLALEAATAQLREIQARPTAAELQAEQERVAAAQAALDRLRAEPAPPEADLSAAAYDVVLLEKVVEQERARVASLEQKLADTRLVAPKPGVVSRVYVRPGSQIDANRPLAVLSTPGEPIVRVELEPDDVNRVAVGQTARIDSEIGEITGAITSLTRTATGVVRSAWPEAALPFGSLVDVFVNVAHKDNVLVIPQTAVRSAGARTLVDTNEGSNQRTVDVRLGIASNGVVEVLSGLREGQQIRVRS